MAEINDRARPRNQAASRWITGKGKAMFAEAVQADAGTAIERARLIVQGAVPEAAGEPWHHQLVARAITRGYHRGAVSAGELRRMHDRFKAGGAA